MVGLMKIDLVLLVNVDVISMNLVKFKSILLNKTKIMYFLDQRRTDGSF
jgi:hypothetical protein